MAQIKVKRGNPQDATLRNVRAAQRRLVAMAERVRKLERRVFALERRV